MTKPVWRLNWLCVGVIATLCFFALWLPKADAAINEEITFYGNLKDASSTPLTGNYDMVFRFYDAASGGTLLDTSTHTAGNGNAVSVDEGEFIVRLGSGTGNALDGIDFNTSAIYVGLTVGTDSEMTPRTRLTAAAYAFNSDTIDGLDSTQFVRSDTVDSISANSASTILSLTQTGVGDIFNVFDGGSEVFTILDGGNVGVGTTTPYADLSVAGNLALTGGFYDNNGTRGTSGMVLQSTGSGLQWVATSTLGFAATGGGSLFTDGGAVTYLTATSDNLAIGGTSGSAKLTVYGDVNILSTTGLAFDGVRTLYTSTTSKSILVGEEAGQYFSSGSTFNTALGYQALKGSSTVPMTGDYNTALGASAGFSNVSGYSNTFIGTAAGYSNLTGYSNEFIGDSAGYSMYAGSENVIIGSSAASAATIATANIIIGFQAGDDITIGSNNIIIGYDIDSSPAANNNTINIGNMIYATDVDGTGTTLSSGNVGIGTSSPYARLSVAGDLALTGRIYDNAATQGTNGQILLSTGSGIQWVATTTLGLASATSTLFQDGGATTYLKSSDNFAVGTTTSTHDFTIYRQFGADMAIRSGSTGTADLAMYGYRLNDNNALAQITGYNLGTDDVARIAFYRDGNDDAGTIRFATQQNGSSLAEKMRLTSYGLLGIGTTTPAQQLQVFGDIRVGTVGTNGCLEDYSGTLISGTCSSDERLKTEILSIENNHNSYLEGIVALEPVTYHWNETAGNLYNKDTNVQNLGLIAQNVEEVFPELVSEDDKGYRQVDFRALPFYLIQALKEMWQELTSQDSRLSDLERENARLKQRLSDIEQELRIEPEQETVVELESEPEPEPQSEEIVDEESSDAEVVDDSPEPEEQLEEQIETPQTEPEAEDSGDTI